MQFIYGTSAVLQSELMVEVARYRFNVFVKKLGWQLPCQEGLEYDEFDDEKTVYVVAQDDDGNVVGTARLLPTTGPYLLAKLFPSLWGSGELPNSPDVWELSRFASVDTNGVAHTLPGQFSSAHATQLLDSAIDCARIHGASELITVSPVGVERLLAQAGYQVRRAGIPGIVGGARLVSLRFSQLSTSNTSTVRDTTSRIQVPTMQSGLVAAA